MARARNIKPGFFKNEELAECSLAARLCFAGLWTLADRDGRLEDRPKRIKAELFAFDNFDADQLLDELAARGFILRYGSEGGRLIQIVNFAKHQNPHHREPESVLPPPTSPGLGMVGMGPKPEAQPSCDGADAQGKPEADPGIEPPQDDLARGSSRADSLIPDSLIPSSPKKTRARPRAAPVSVPVETLIAAGFDGQTAADFLAHKAGKGAPLTQRAWADHCREAAKAGWTPQQAAEKVMARNWSGFEAKYVVGDTPAAERSRTGAALLDADHVFEAAR